MGSRVALGVLSCLGVAALSAHPASAQLVRVYATNSGGDAVSIIDPASHKTVASLNEIEVDVFDQKTNKLIKKVVLSGHPNNIAVAKDASARFTLARDRRIARQQDAVGHQHLGKRGFCL